MSVTGPVKLIEPPIPPVPEVLISPFRFSLPTPAFRATVPPLLVIDVKLVLELIGPVVIPPGAFSAIAPPVPEENVGVAPVAEAKEEESRLVVVMLPVVLIAIAPPVPALDVARAPFAIDEEEELRMPVITFPLAALIVIAPP